MLRKALQLAKKVWSYSSKPLDDKAVFVTEFKSHYTLKLLPRVENFSREVFGFKKYKNHFYQTLGFGWRATAFGVLIYLLASSSLVSFFRDQAWADKSEKVSTVEFYSSKCLENNFGSVATSSWQGVDNVTGQPSVVTATDVYSVDNSAVYEHGAGELVCGDFAQVGEVDKVLATTTEIVSTSTQNLATTTPEEVATGTEEIKDEPLSPQASSTTKQTTNTQEIVDQASTTKENALPEASSTPPSAEASTTQPTEEPPTENKLQAVIDEVILPILKSNPLDAIVNYGVELLTGVKQEAGAAEKVKTYTKIDEIESAKINLSLAIVDNNILSTSTIATTSVASITDPATADTEIATGSKKYLDLLEDQSSEVKQVESQTAPRQSAGDLKIWYSLSTTTEATTSGELWQELARVPLATSTDCAQIVSSYSCLKRSLDLAQAGGQLVFDAPFLQSGVDVNKLRLKVTGEVLASSTLSVYLDGMWVSVEPKSEAEVDDGYETADKIVFDGKEINFAFTDDNTGENLIIKSNAKDYTGVVDTEVYFSVTNIGSTSELVNLQAHFPLDMGGVTSLERLKLRDKQWEKTELEGDALPEQNILTKTFGNGHERKYIPGHLRAKESTKVGNRLAPGKTQYYKMKINFPSETNGEFYIEAVGDNNGYGLLDPWWSSSWLYKMPITIDNRGNAVGLTDYQMLIEISSTTASFWSKVLSNGADVRFTNASQTVSLSFWIQYWDKTSSTTQIWVKTDSLPASATTTIYLFYGNASAASSSDMYSTFSYSAMQDLYYVVDNNLTGARISVVSLIDNNQVQLGTSSIVNLNRQGTTTFAAPTSTMALKAKGPIMAKIDNIANADALVPVSFGGRQFIFSSPLGTESFARFALWNTTNVRLANGATDVPAGAATVALGVDNVYASNVTNMGIVEASSSILSYMWTNTPGYSMVGYPSTKRDLYGIKSSTIYAGVGTNATTYSVFCSNGTTANQVSTNRGNRLTIATCAAGTQGSGNAVRLTNITQPINAIQYNDGDGAELTQFFGDTDLSPEYMVPTGTQYIAIACPPKYATNTIALYNQNNVFVSSTTCIGYGNYPGKAFFGSTTNGVFIATGSRVTSLVGESFYAYYEDAQAIGTSAGGDETNLLGAVQGREGASSTPTYSFGAEQSFAIVFSGTVYSNEGVTALLTAPIVSLVIDGRLVATTTASAVNGTFSFNYATTTLSAIPRAGSSTLVYLDNGTVFGATYSRYLGNGDVTNLNIYQDRVIVEHDDAGPITNADIVKWDATQDANIKVDVTGLNLVASATQMLYIAASSTYAPGGSVTLLAGSASSSAGGDLKIASSTSVFNAATNNVSIGGDWLSNGSLIDGAGQITTFTATSTGFTVQNNGQNFANVIFNGTGGGWSFGTSTTLDGNLTMTAGTLTGTTSLTINGGNATGTTGVINLSAGIFTLNNGGNFGGGVDWTFSDLTFGTGSVASVIKTGNGNVNISDALIIATSTTLNAATSTWQIAGTGTPFSLLGSLVASTSLFKFIATSAVSVATTTYYNLELAPSGAGSPIYTLGAGSLNINNYLYIGNGTNPVTVTASTSNTILHTGGDVFIRASSTLIASPLYGFNVGGSWTNSGVFTANGGVLTFDASTTGKTISAGSSTFATVAFNNSLGGWTINQNATSTGNWSLTAGSQFTVSPNVIMTVKGQYNRSMSGASTTWTNSILYLNGVSQDLNLKSDAGDVYGTLQIGNNLNYRMWNSSAATTTVSTSSSLYSMDHGAVNGSLYIWGNYISSSTEYWSYATDFDGTSLAGVERQVNVRMADNATTTISSTTLNIIGSSTATTTIANQGSGTYALNIATSTLNANYYQIRNINNSGLNIYGSSTVTSIDYADLLLQTNGASMITLNAQSMSNSGTKVFGHMVFASSTGITGFNVNLSGTPTVTWDFSSSTGVMASENYDVDAGDPRGYLIWSDSPDWTPKSQRWRWYSDQTAETPVVPLAAEIVAPSGVARANMLKLRLTIKETLNLPASNVKMRLQYSTVPDFSSGVYDVAEIGSSTSVWNYGNGVDLDNATITTRLLTDATTTATHNESGVSTSSFSVLASSSNEWEFTIFNNAGVTGTTYYFRAFSPQYKLGAVSINTGQSYPSVVVGDNSLAANLTGVATGTVLNGVTTSFASTPTTLTFGTLSFGTAVAGAHQVQISTNGETGYQLFIKQQQNFQNSASVTMSQVVADNTNPLAWPTGQTPSAFGYHTSDATLSGASPSRFTADNTYAKLETTMREIGFSANPVTNDSVNVIYKLEVTNMQGAGDYQGSVEYILVPTY